MSTDNTYEGWSNRETWATNLWLANDEGLYTQTTEMAGAALREAMGWDDDRAPNVQEIPEARYLLARGLEEQFDEYAADIVAGEPTTEALRSMILDIGSLYRVDWSEVAEAWISSAIEEHEANR